MKKYPLVSVVLLVHNGKRSLTDAIKNINEQDCKFLEIIIVSDENTDKFSENTIQFQNISRYIYHTSMG